MDISMILYPLLDAAVKNLERLKEHYKTLGIVWGSIESNPMSDAVEILRELEVC